MIINNCYLHNKFGIFCCWRDDQIKNLLKTMIFRRIIEITLNNDTYLNFGSLRLTDNVNDANVCITNNVSMNLHKKSHDIRIKKNFDENAHNLYNIFIL